MNDYAIARATRRLIFEAFCQWHSNHFQQNLIGMNEVASIFVYLPKQLVTETTDGVAHNRDGVERHGSPQCVVVSADEFNDSQANGLIVVPIISAANVDLAKFKTVPSTWVRVITHGEHGYALVEQLRYIDRSRCKAQIGVLIDFDLKQVENKLKQLLFQ